MLKITNKLRQLEMYEILRGNDDQATLQTVPQDADTQSDEKDGGSRILPAATLDDGKRSCGKQEDDDNGRSMEREKVDKTLRHYNVSHDRINLFKKTEDILPFKKRKYKLLIFITVTTNTVYPVETVFGTGAGPNFTWVDFLNTEWQKDIHENCRSIFK